MTDVTITNLLNAGAERVDSQILLNYVNLIVTQTATLISAERMAASVVTRPQRGTENISSILGESAS